ncbi:Alpha/Beta hydrolase protein [Bisporella sp. PMI_857]|nr:Alpha/Beta hydrolase protein [Bisporella sp. PMI_857]
MRLYSIVIILLSLVSTTICTPLTEQRPLQASQDGTSNGSNLSIKLFAELEEFSRIVDISYCVGMTGISKPFRCSSRCDDFPEFELVDTFNTGPLMSDSCGYIALDHSTKHQGKGRIIVAFRGTYSIANTIVDLSTVPQEYLPYPDDPENQTTVADKPKAKCNNCTVHTGFWNSWQNTRAFILPHIEAARSNHPNYQLHLVGHSLGGAVAALAGLEFETLGFNPTITTFGEPRVGNSGLRDWIDLTFSLPSEHNTKGGHELKAGRYRRITHIDDPVPLLPLQEWGYRSHAGEVYISKPSLQPALPDVHLCFGDEDVDCLAGAEAGESWFNVVADIREVLAEGSGVVTMPGSVGDAEMLRKRWGLPIPARYKIWQLFFAHRDYFWRLGLCVPGGDPLDWGRNRYDFGDDEDKPPKLEL